MIATLPRLTEAEIKEQYNGRWVLLTDFIRNPDTYEWLEAVVLADAPPEDNSALFELEAHLGLKNSGIIFIGTNPYPVAILF